MDHGYGTRSLSLIFLLPHLPLCSDGCNRSLRTRLRCGNKVLRMVVLMVNEESERYKTDVVPRDCLRLDFGSANEHEICHRTYETLMQRKLRTT